MRGSEGVELGVRQSRRGAIPGADRNLDRQIMQVVDRVMSSKLSQLPVWQQKLEVLNGDRLRAITQAAVRRQDLSGITLEPASQEVTTVTPEDYNALVRDVHAIMEALNGVAKRLS